MAGELPVQVNLDAYQGDSWFQTFRLKTNNVVVDLTGAVVKSGAHGPGSLYFDVPVTLTNPVGGELMISLPSGMRAGSYRYDIQVAKAGVTTTWITGRLDVGKEVVA
jgi:hypothetical protein